MPTTADLDTAAAHAKAMLQALAITGDDQTATRFVKALDELTQGRRQDPRRHLTVTFPPASTEPGLITVTDVPFVSMCEHHLLPFTGTATVAYLPEKGAPIVGLSKLARLVQEYAARPQVQERLTDQVVTALADIPGAVGAACAIRSVHSCMSLRGAKTGVGAAMTTAQYAGELSNNPWRGEFNARLSTTAWAG